MKKVMWILAVLVCLSSCELTIEPELSQVGNRLLVECIPFAYGDSTVVKVFATEPLNTSESLKPLEDVRVSLTRNKMDVELKPTASMGVYYTDCQFEPGDRVAVTAFAEDYEKASSPCLVPSAPSYSVKYLEEKGKYENSYRLQLEFISSETEEEYYAVSVREMSFWESVTWRRGYREYSIKPGDVERFPSAEGQYEIVGKKKNEIPGFDKTDYKEYNGEYLYIFPVKGKCVLNTPLYRKNREVRSISYYKYGDTTVRGYQYLLKVYKMDALTYSYMVPSKNDYMIGLGLMPPFSSPTNVEGGYGCLGALGAKKSEGWVEYDPDGISVREPFVSKSFCNLAE